MIMCCAVISRPRAAHYWVIDRIPLAEETILKTGQREPMLLVSVCCLTVDGGPSRLEGCSRETLSLSFKVVKMVEAEDKKKGIQK